MNNFSPVATDYAVEMHDRITRGLRARYRTFALTSQEVQKRKDFLVLVNRLARDMQQARISNYPEGSFAAAMEVLVPIWVEEVDHNRTHSFEQWLPVTSRWNIWKPDRFNHHDMNLVLDALDLFFTDCYGVSETEFNRRVARVEEALKGRFTAGRYDTPAEYIKPVVSAGTFDIRELFAVNVRAKKIVHYAKYLEQGHKMKHIHKLHQRAPFICSPGFLDQFVNLYGTATLNQMFALITDTRQLLTEEHVAGLLNAGYRTSKEVHQYARQFNISVNSQRYFDRVIEAKIEYPVLPE